MHLPFTITGAETQASSKRARKNSLREWSAARAGSGSFCTAPRFFPATVVAIHASGFAHEIKQQNSHPPSDGAG